MKKTRSFCLGGLSLLCLIAQSATAQNQAARAGDAKDAGVKGADVRGHGVTDGPASDGSVSGGTVAAGAVPAGTVTPGTVTAVAGGREILVRAHDPVSIEVKDGEAEVRIGAHRLLVQKEKLTLTGELFVRLPAAARKVVIEARDSTIIIWADGAEAGRMKLK